MSWVDPSPGPHFFMKTWKNYRGFIPFIVSDLIGQLKKLQAEKKEGLFRLSAQKSVVDSLCRELDRGRVRNLEEYTDVDVIASALKKFFGEHALYDPLIEMEAYQIMPHIFGADGPDEAKILKLKSIIIQFEPSSRNSLGYLMRYLNFVHLNSEYSKMDASNLAICFSPAIYPNTDACLTEGSRKAIYYMITCCDQIFEPEWTLDDKFMSNFDVTMLSFPEIDPKDLNIEQERRKLRKISIIPGDIDCLEKVLGLTYPENPVKMLE